jgi:hypothetical protein
MDKSERRLIRPLDGVSVIGNLLAQSGPHRASVKDCRSGNFLSLAPCARRYGTMLAHAHAAFCVRSAAACGFHALRRGEIARKDGVSVQDARVCRQIAQAAAQEAERHEARISRALAESQARVSRRRSCLILPRSCAKATNLPTQISGGEKSRCSQ